MKKMVLVVVLGALAGCVIFLMYRPIPVHSQTVQKTLDADALLNAAIEQDATTEPTVEKAAP